jgi:cob(I)alamin adenosyltransferase
MIGEKDTMMIRIGPDHIDWLESRIDELSEDIPPLVNFILPGGGKTSALLHLSRTVCRRGERWAVALGHQEDIGDHVLPYLNRLSDLLFVLARYANQKEGVDESMWRIKG